jgi:two-component system response regulator MprA
MIESRRTLVLVVDDDLRTTRLLAKMLREDGFDVDLATHGAAAIGRLSRGPLPDVIVTDFLLPYADGFAVARFGRLQRPALPILVMTGYPEQTRKREQTLDPPAMILTKPIEYGVLRAELQRLTRKSEVPPAPVSRIAS